jgi:glycosyltransferase involved in cell wall biosynthesis
MRIYQFLETFSDADAIGYHVMGIDKLIRDHGFETGIFANNIDEKCIGLAKHFKSFEFDDGEDVLLFHHSIGSDVYEYLKGVGGIKKLIFHNITPPVYFKHRPDFMRELERGYKQMFQFNSVFSSAICDSEFNRKVLELSGYKKKVKVIPPFVSLADKFGIPLKIKKAKRFRILCVSQIALHKNQIRLVKIFKTYQKFFNPDSELYMVGGYCLQDLYYERLLKEIEGNKSVYLTGKIPLTELKHLYENSHLFLSMSEHEGFSVPLVEAMYFELPVIAYRAGAVPDTLKSGGILLNTDDPLTVGAAIETIREDKIILANFRQNQKKIIKFYNGLLIEKDLSEWLLKN